jgi:nitrogen regulatory protein PII
MPDILMKKSEAGRIRDGEVIVYDVEGAIRFRNDERGEAAL